MSGIKTRQLAAPSANTLLPDPALGYKFFGTKNKQTSFSPVKKAAPAYAVSIPIIQAELDFISNLIKCETMNWLTGHLHDIVRWGYVTTITRMLCEHPSANQ